MAEPSGWDRRDAARRVAVLLPAYSATPATAFT